MTRALAIMAFEALQRAVRLPFIGQDAGGHMNAVRTDVFTDPDTNVTLTICASPLKRRHVQPSPMLPLPGFGDLVDDEPSERILLHELLDFPIHIRWEAGSRLIEEHLVQPSWLESPYESRDLQEDLGKGRKTPYTACNVLLIRRDKGCEEILLSRRLRGSGYGEYTLPGGKQDPNESIEACIRRELVEELGIEYKSGYPISYRITQRAGFPRVKSVGVLATEWRGEPRRKELLAHSDWKWYRMTNLPSPLFFPSEMAIDDFLNKSFPELEWRTIEPEVPLPLWG